MDIREKIGSRISELRKEKGLSQYKLAEISGVSRGHINRIEMGLYNVRLDILEKLVKPLGYKIEIEKDDVIIEE